MKEKLPENDFFHSDDGLQGKKRPHRRISVEKISGIALPAFLGFTATPTGQEKPVLIQSYNEFLTVFGEQPLISLSFEKLQGTNPPSNSGTKFNGHFFKMGIKAEPYLLHSSIKLFFRNGGEYCYVLALNPYQPPTPTLAAFQKGLDLLKDYLEINLISAPDALLLAKKPYYEFCQQLLNHCEQMGNRMAILEVYEGYHRWEKKYIDTRYAFHEVPSKPDIVNNFRDGIGRKSLRRGMAFFPWLHTNVFREEDFLPEFTELPSELPEQVLGLAQQNPETPMRRRDWHQEFAKAISTYSELLGEALREINQLPPGPAAAAILYQNDVKKGIWKSSANTAIKAATSPTYLMTRVQVVDLQLPLNGKSVNPIRPFSNAGSYIAKAKTLAGNSHEWRYICHARTIFFIQDMILFLIEKAREEGSNVAKKVEAFLAKLFEQGALKGKHAENAFKVAHQLANRHHPERLIVNISVVVSGVYSRLDFPLANPKRSGIVLELNFSAPRESQS